MVKKPKSDVNKPEMINEKIKLLEKENAELAESCKRLAADFDNYRKRKETEHAQASHLATNGLVAEIFPILDNFRRASEHAPAIQISDKNVPELSEDELRKISAYFDGIRQIEKQLEGVLSSAGLTHIETIGKQFDPHTMEAIAYEPHPELEEGTVIDELEGGYKLNDKVVRCAKVRVSSGK
ncbi:MAG: nucleotide exchange factor GrpE [bacterium]|nr:nucleotide exchange factor GrpE [bacterium]